MAIGLLGKKLGMTHVYDDYGRRMAVTVIQAGPCTIVRVRQTKPDGYRAVQLGFELIAEKKLRKPVLGQFKKAGVSPFHYVRELRLDHGNGAKTANESEWKVGQQLTVELFQPYELVDVVGVSVGKGFQGGMKRWHWRGGSETHGSMQHRAPGSIGSTTTPGRVWKGHHLPGHMGGDRVTVQNLRLITVDVEHNLLVVQGAIPGAEDGLVVVTKSKKHPGLIRKPRELQEIIEEDETLSKTAKAASKKLKSPSPAAK
ncbi:MAG: 50S ribosomal protein L3 [Candidatus Omnitrophica bacterium]|nr:50S ribosomal protein L3 [Candidatus Omnitrophota bacterium]